MFRVGDLVEVRSREEILSLLGSDGCMPRDRLPFMAEMLQHCGKRFRVSAIAHKTCDTATLLMGRRMHDTVFLENLRCDGSAHGGCQARCLMFWRTNWLRRADGSLAKQQIHPNPSVPCTERELEDAGRVTLGNGDIRYICQATEHWAASEPLRPLAPWHFIADVRTGNATLGQVLRVLVLNLVFRLRYLARGWRVSVWMYEALHRRILGRPYPFRPGVIAAGARTPDDRLDLEPGEWVEVKSHDEILDTVSVDLKNRGMKYNAELTPFCGRKFRVAHRVSKIIEEHSGRMIHMRNPCITLDGVYCQALYTDYSLLCSRRAVPYFREIWLRRTSEPVSSEEGS